MWEDKNYSPLLASYFQNEKLFCDILIHLGPHTSPKSCSVQIVFEQKYSFLHDVYLTNKYLNNVTLTLLSHAVADKITYTSNFES